MMLGARPGLVIEANAGSQDARAYIPVFAVLV
jgi:hypothetical protein